LLDSGALKEESIVNKVGFATNYLHVSFNPINSHVVLTYLACHIPQRL
jgi:hypothetical protein